MHQVGYEMYVSLLEKAVRSLRGQKEEPVERILTGVEIPVDAYLPTIYIENPKDRFAFYKRIAGAPDLESLLEIETEMRDRYGEMPAEVTNLVDVAAMRLYAGKMGITQVALKHPDVVMGRERLNLKVEVPHLFPLDKVVSLDRKFPGAEFDRRSQCLSIPIDKSSDALDRGLALVRHLSQGE
jgi:transcription-repair coupling factor (superfamily II helicase)